MMDEYERNKRTQVGRVRSVMDYSMGVAFSVIGGIFLFYQLQNRPLLHRNPDPVNYFIGLLFLAYGAWRIYRGYKKNYFREE